MVKNILAVSSCDVALAMSVVGGKWKIIIIWKLVDKRLRFSELRRSLGTISEGVLITQLKELERDGVVRRITYPEVPPRVEYELTPAGHLIKQAVRELERWGSQHRTLLSAKD